MSTLPETHRNYKKLLAENPTRQQIWEIVNDFISFYSAEGIKEELWMLTIGTLSSDQVEEVEKGIDRYNRIFFYEHSSLFIDAVSLLLSEHKSRHSKKDKQKKKGKRS